MTSTVRSRMQAVKRRNTKPEIIVKAALRSAHVHYRSGYQVHRPNSADILLPERRIAVFVNGCFWHGHAFCKRARLPNRRQAYWKTKVRVNQARDQRAYTAYVIRGWIPVVLWECEVLNHALLASIVDRLANWEH